MGYLEEIKKLAMANGKPSDHQEYVIRSGVRSGLKREFAFALKSQAELASSLSGGRSRTRSGKPPSSTPTPPLPPRRDSNKRFKKSSPSSNLADSPLPPAQTPLPVLDAAGAADKIKPLPPKAEEEKEVQGESAKPMQEEEEEEEPAVEDPIVHQGSQVDGHASAPLQLEETSSPPTPPHPPSVVDANHVPKGNTNNSNSNGPQQQEEEMQMVIDVPPMVCSGGAVEDGPMPETPVPASSPADEVRIEDSVAAAVVDNALETPLTIDATVEEIGLPLEKPSERFTRSSLNVPQNEEGSPSGVENPVLVNADKEKPARRFTRSLLKVPAEDTSAGEASATTTSGGSVGSDETKGGGNGDDGSSTTAPGKKMELKMSKKIALSKFPTNVRDLLGTGLLEGYPVKYLVYVGKVCIALKEISCCLHLYLMHVLAHSSFIVSELYYITPPPPPPQHLFYQ